MSLATVGSVKIRMMNPFHSLLLMLMFQYQFSLSQSQPPSVMPTLQPSAPTCFPSYAPSRTPTAGQTYTPTLSIEPSAPTGSPTQMPTGKPTSASQTNGPSLLSNIPPTSSTSIPTQSPSSLPTTTSSNYSSFNSTLDITFCESCACPVTYALVNNSCELCNFPMQSNKNKLVLHSSGQFLMYDPCSVAGLGTSYFDMVLVLTTFFCAFGCGIAASAGDFKCKNLRGGFFLLIFHEAFAFAPYMLFLSFLLTSQFYNVTLLASYLLSFLFVHILLIVVLVSKTASPKFWILQTPSILIFKDYSPIANNVLMGISFIPFFIINLSILLFWFTLGGFLFVSNLLTLPLISNTWFGVWTGGVHKNIVIDRKKDMELDFFVLHISLLFQTFLQFIPLLLIQFINAPLVGKKVVSADITLSFTLINVLFVTSRFVVSYCYYGIPLDKPPYK